MSLIAVLLSICFFKVCVVTSDSWDCADYYWRDYYGTIPDDAVPAGKDHSGNLRYVALVYLRGYELLPGTILTELKAARTNAYGRVFLATQNVKVLCSPHTEAFEWISIQSKDLHHYTNRNLIPGGSEVGESLYIGRVFRNDDVIVGKIFRHERDNRGIGFALGNGTSTSLSYDIVLYNCDKVPGLDLDLRASFFEKKN